MKLFSRPSGKKRGDERCFVTIDWERKVVTWIGKEVAKCYLK
jgi:hypothetical protein